ncbi:unnamed protein product [Fusarium equiseti]|uniref:Uncharacterized protein n=1 Tax=Fusarium equiseti TaxID=61235 RepID=A0A8J2NP17_FUSEQ|nr:unnamed protein product [Fusarium equiseti]
MSFPGDTLPSPPLLPPVALSPGASLIILNHLNTVQQDIVTDIKAMTALEKRAGKRSIGVQTDEVPPKRLRRGASPIITESVDMIGLCSGSEGEFESQPKIDIGDLMGCDDVSSCSLGQIPPAPQLGSTLFIANSYHRPLGEVNTGRLEASN